MNIIPINTVVDVLDGEALLTGIARTTHQGMVKGHYVEAGELMHVVHLNVGFDDPTGRQHVTHLVCHADNLRQSSTFVNSEELRRRAGCFSPTAPGAAGTPSTAKEAPHD